MLAGDGTQRPALLALRIGGSVEAWRAVGFAVSAEGDFAVGETTVRLLPDGPPGITEWCLTSPVAGVASCAALAGPAPPAVHPNGVTAIDHVVVTTSDLEASTAAFVNAGCAVRGERCAAVAGRDVVQRFLPLQNALVELVGPASAGGQGADSGTSFWGVTFVSLDLAGAGAALGPHVGAPRPAVQPGRLIAVAAREAGLGTRVAFMTPRDR